MRSSQPENHRHHQPPPPPPPQQQQQPRSCPRCDSFNTKFCYYNNYSLTQPRYFCKNCRRYWTHGGTLRNVPVGGGCRRGKRVKTTSQVSSPPPPPSPPPNPSSSAARVAAAAGINSSIGSFCSGGGFLPSFSEIQSFNTNQGMNQNFSNAGGDFGGSSNMGLMGFNPPMANFGSPNVYGSDWHQRFGRNSDPNVTDAALWSSGNSTAGGGGGGGAGSLSSTHWPNNLPGYGPAN